MPDGRPLTSMARAQGACAYHIGSGQWADGGMSLRNRTGSKRFEVTGPLPFDEVHNATRFPTSLFGTTEPQFHSAMKQRDCVRLWLSARLLLFIKSENFQERGSLWNRM